MKSSFAFIALYVFLCTSVLAQSGSVATAGAKSATPSSSFDKFYDRLKIGYFAMATGSTLDHWDNSSISEQGVKDYTSPPNVFNQVSFNYNFGWKMNFVLNPRWTNNLTAGNGVGNKTFAVMEDWLTGLQGVIHTSEDKKYNLWVRAGARLPTSRGSRAANITWQPEVMLIPSYDFNTTWQLGGYIQARYWVYEQKYTDDRYRLYLSPYLMYTINDTTKVQVFYQMQNDKKLGTKTVRKYYEDVMFAISKDITPKLNFMPFVGYYLHNQWKEQTAIKYPFNESYFGFWLSYQIK
ncbi:MAG: hypothetical protein AB7I27_09885 [Bacteriovoracaceae bacterium]